MGKILSGDCAVGEGHGTIHHEAIVAGPAGASGEGHWEEIVELGRGTSWNAG